MNTYYTLRRRNKSKSETCSEYKYMFPQFEIQVTYIPLRDNKQTTFKFTYTIFLNCMLLLY